MMLGQLSSHLEKDKIRSSPQTIHKNKLQLDQESKSENIYILEENRGEFSYNLSIVKRLANYDLKLNAIKEKINKFT